MTEKQNWRISSVDGLAVDLLPTLAGLFALSLFIFYANIYHYDCVALTSFDTEKLSWRDPSGEGSQATTAVWTPSENDPEKVKKALVPVTLPQFQLDEFSARTVWLCSNYLMIAAGFALLWQSTVVLKREVQHKWWIWIFIAMIPGVAIWLLKTMTKLGGEDVQIIGAMESKAASLSKLSPNWVLDDAENLLVLATCCLFSFAIGSLSSGRDRTTVVIGEVVRRARDAAGLLNICAVFLVLGVFHLWTQWNWPITFLTSPMDRAFLRLSSNALALNVGALFTVMLGAIYFTAHARLRNSAYQLADSALRLNNLPNTDSSICTTLQGNGFTDTTLFDIPSLIKVLSPLIAAGPVAQLVSWVYAY